jgi:DEAD/DEAH box helicase
LAAQAQQPYVLTTGTGSGKSLSYVVPIIDDILRHPEIKGVRAILVYPMNVLINSQKEEFDKFLKQVPNSHIRVEQYTGQEKFDRKNEIQENPPHILLTNYVMLELMLSRTHERKFVESADLKFLVLDELHTYWGRQGADVAMVIRKLRQRSGHELLCIGTSATMSTEGDRTQRRATVAGVASKLFGVEVLASNVIDETLKQAITFGASEAIDVPVPSAEDLRDCLTAELPVEMDRTLDNFRRHPLSAWIEMNFGLQDEDGHLIRRTPISLQAGAVQLAELAEVPIERCTEALQKMFLWGSRTTGLAFRLHQFIAQGCDYISRPRNLAIREMAPGNILYYEGSKFKIDRTKRFTKGAENEYQRLVVCHGCGYFHTSVVDICENCGQKPTADKQGKPANITKALEMDTMSTRRRERITCDEEDRLKSGYQINTYFRFTDQRQESAIVADVDNTPLLKLTYGETAEMMRLNRGLRSTKEWGFRLDTGTGRWVTSADAQACYECLLSYGNNTKGSMARLILALTMSGWCWRRFINRGLSCRIPHSYSLLRLIASQILSILPRS